MGLAEGRGTKSGTTADKSDLLTALAALLRLPLSEHEKAEAVRRLLADHREDQL